jgi:hypothetical protein
VFLHLAAAPNAIKWLSGDQIKGEVFAISDPGNGRA